MHHTTMTHAEPRKSRVARRSAALVRAALGVAGIVGAISLASGTFASPSTMHWMTAGSAVSATADPGTMHWMG